MITTEEWLFIGTYPNAYIYADNRKCTGGDYHGIATIYFRPLELKIKDDSEKYKEVVAMAKARFEEIKNNINTPLIISTTGQTAQPYLKS